MKRILSLATAAALATSLTATAMANGQGTPIEPVAPPPEAEPLPEGPVAESYEVEEASSGPNWVLLGIAAIVVVAVIIAISDDDDDDGKKKCDKKK